jgi:hypothetical protein
MSKARLILVLLNLAMFASFLGKAGLRTFSDGD